MLDDSQSFITRTFLRSSLDQEYRNYVETGVDAQVRQRLLDWDNRHKLTETQAEGAFVQTFFVETWNYGETGRVTQDEHTLIPKFRIPGEGPGGGQAEADLALGWFKGRPDAIPQALCEFKDIKSDLDQPQKRKNSKYTPVQQCLAYLRGARKGLFGNEVTIPQWGIVTDMNEFRLYWWDRTGQYLRFVIRPRDLFGGSYTLYSENEDACFDRFLFSKIFHRDFLIAHIGPSALRRLIEKQWVKEKALEKEFYGHYRGLRERLFDVLRARNPNFPGTPTELLRLSQKILDRFIFAFYCEDMGERMMFPPQLLKERLKSRSSEETYEPDGEEFWQFFKQLFSSMNSGKSMGSRTMPYINGGLFAPDPAIEALSIPNVVFAAVGQGQNEPSLDGDPKTFFYLSARYNYASSGFAKDSLSLYTLGHIFEQSITELEFREGELEERDSIAKLSKRKRDGVYYTPEEVVNYLVEHTLAPWFADAKRNAGYPEDASDPSREAIEAYLNRLGILRILDPACGSGAFLISAFRRLLEERRAAAKELVKYGTPKKRYAVDDKSLISSILADNIYGVDLNPSSVEIAKLALWLHSARADAPLSSLDHNIRCGNSLVGEDFWNDKSPNEVQREAVRAFNWQHTFPEVFNQGGFDIVLGNPPYVKLQNFKKAYPDVADYLVRQRGEDTYQSTQTGNYDLYLPFIEKGLRLLAPGGRMAYIAPSLWVVNEYGEGLRRVVGGGRHLERWVDFKAHQVFEEATTYTALQFFSKSPNSAVRVAIKGDGKACDVDWADQALRLDYNKISPVTEWIMATGVDRALIDRLAESCLRLDDASLTEAISVGIQTSADDIYHLKRVSVDQYFCRHKAHAGLVEIEDEIMKPLVSGLEADRYQEPEVGVRLLFPYTRDETGSMNLMTAEHLQTRFPKAWRYLSKWETALRARESGKMDGPNWWGYNYPKNLDKQDRPKLIVPRLVDRLKASFDESGQYWLDNVDAGAVIGRDSNISAYLLGVLNGPIANFVFRTISKPFKGDYRSANKQFIAPLPIPRASETEKAAVATCARRLQTRWTRRRQLLTDAMDRFGVLPRTEADLARIWPDLPGVDVLTAKAPRALVSGLDRQHWADDRRAELEVARLAELEGARNHAGRLEVRFQKGELKLFAGGMAVLNRIYLSDSAGVLAEAYWRYLLLSGPNADTRKFALELSRLPTGDNAQAAQQFIERVKSLTDESAAIEVEEAEMNERLYKLYNLTPEERLLVESDRRPSRKAANLT